MALHPGLIAVFTLPKLVLLSWAAALCALGALRRGGFGARTVLDRPLLAGAAVLAVSALFSEDPRRSVEGMYNFYVYGLWPLALCAALCRFAAWESQRARPVSKACLGVGALVGAAAVLELLGVELLPGVTRLVGGGRAVSTLGSPVSLGAYLALLWAPALHWALAERKERLFGGLCLAGVGGGLLASVSRASWLSAAAGTAAYLAFSGRLRPLFSNRRRLAVLLALAAAGGAAMVWRFSARTYARGGDRARVEVWRTAWTLFRERPWLGVGPDAFELGFRRLKSLDYVRASTTEEYQAHAHNDLLEALSTAGLLGFSAYFYFLCALAIRAAEALRDKERPLNPALAAGLLSLFINMKFNPVPIEAIATAGLMAGFLCGSAGAPRRGGGLVLAGVVAAAGASAFAASRRFAADWQAKLAQNLAAAGRPELALARYERALRLNPCELSYHIALANLQSARAAANPDPGLRRELLEPAQRSGEAALRCHPNSSQSHYILGVAALMQAQSGLPERLPLAERELDEALARDPLFAPLLESRLRAAELAGRAGVAAELSRRIGALNASPRP